MSDLLRSQLLIQDASSAPFIRAPRRSFAHPCILESALCVWQQQPVNSPSSNLFANAPYNGDVFGEMESCGGLGEAKQIEDPAFGFVRNLEHRSASQAFKGGSDCRPLWMHNPAAVAAHLLPQMHAHNAENPSEQAPEMELSRRLILRPDAACLASPAAECLDPKMLQPSASIPSLAANGWSVAMSASNLATRFMQQHGCAALGTVDSHDSVAQYSFDTAFAERAAKFTSFSSEPDYSGFSNSPPLLQERRGVICADGSSFHQLEGQNSPKKMVASPLSYASPGMSSPVGDRRTVKFALASPLDVKAPKNEIQDECISDGGNLVDDDRRLCSPSARVDEANGLQQIERKVKLPEDTTSNPPHGHSVGGNLKLPQNGLRLKRGRAAAESQERVAPLQQPNQGKVVKNEEQVLDVPPKRQKCAPTSKRKQERKTDDEKAKNNESGGESSPKLGTGKATTPAELPKPDFIHVRARRGQATDSHSLAERVRREKISERMRFLQDLVPGCSKITGKAMMLDEIINYVQSLQHQVEFLAMKLAAVNPILDFNTESFMEGEMASALAEVTGGVPEMATSLGPHTPNYHAQMHTISAAHLKSGDVAEYAVPIAADDCNPCCNNLEATDRGGFSQGNPWKGVGNVSGNLAFDEKILLASRVYLK